MQLDDQTARAISGSLLRIGERSAFFTTLALFARFEASQEVPTAATDGRTIFINPGFWARITTPEQDGVLLHEVLHAALLHVPRRAGRDPQLWNIAADVVVNGLLIREGYALPDGHVRNTSLEHLSVEEVYELLQRRNDQQQQPSPSDLLEQRPSDSPPVAGTPDAPATSQAAQQAVMESYWRDALEEARAGMQTQAIGKLPAGLERELGQTRKAELDWRSYLWRYLTQTPSDFVDFDRRFIGQGTYLEALSGESVQVLVAVDTSGSINQQAVERFMAEVRAILQAYPHLRCELYYADAGLHGPYAVRPHLPLPKPIGGGGTDFRPFFAAIARHPFQWGRTVAIYLTDGYGTFPQNPPRCPVLWVVTPGGKALEQFPFGEAVRLFSK